MKRSSFYLTSLILAGVFASSAYASDTLKVCHSLSLTGVLADHALSSRIGAEIARDQVNDLGGILGRKVEVIVRDDKLNPDEATRTIKDLHINVKCDAYVLSAAGVTQIPQLRYAKENSLLAFAMQGQDMYYLNDLMYPYYFIMGPTAMQEGYALAKYVADRKDIKSYITFAPDYSWGRSNVESFSKTVKQLRPDLKNLGNFYPPLEELEFGSYITNMLGTKADIVVTWVFGTTYISFVKQVAAYGLLGKMEVLSWTVVDDIITGGKDVPSGLIVAMDNEYWTGRRNKNPYYDEFEKEYRKRRGRLPSLGGNQSYDMMMTLMQGIKKAGSFDKDKVAKAIEGSTFMTLRGPLFMRPIDHVFTAGVYFGRTRFDRQLGYSEIVDGFEMPGPELMLSDEEYLKYRKEKRIDFKPWHEKWYKALPWAE
jgi:branched-chain amino acid transport system substrate-binding protein